MNSSRPLVMQSPFYHPSLNNAIFDGPLRLYFAQLHEELALKLYFFLQSQFHNEWAFFKEEGRCNEGSVVLMIYPTEEFFREAFFNLQNSRDCFAQAVWKNCTILGLVGTVSVELGSDSLETFFKTFWGSYHNFKEKERSLSI